MFAVIQNNRVLHCLENPLLCEALVRGFADVAELRAWEANLPRDGKDKPARPPLENTRIVKLSAAQHREYETLLTEGWTEGEILTREMPERADEFEFIGDEQSRARRQDENSWKTIRAKRNKLLQASDKYVLPDFPLPRNKRRLWMSYRQALRDLTVSAKDPHAVHWPSPP